MGMNRVAFLVGAAATAVLVSGCVGGPLRSPNPLGHASTHDDLATGEQFPLRSSPTKDEVDRQFEEQYPGVVNWLYVWGKDRWFDLTDVISWDIGFGRGFGVNVAATEFAQAGLGWWDGRHMGQRGRAWGVWDEHSVDRGLGPFYWIEFERTPVYGTQSIFDHEYKYTGWDLFEEGDSKITNNDWSEVGGHARLLAVSAGVHASPIEAVDFVAGVLPVGLIANVVGYHYPIFDIMGDDTHSQIEQDLREEKGLEQ